MWHSFYSRGYNNYNSNYQKLNQKNENLLYPRPTRVPGTCTAIGNLDHSLNEDCAIMTILRKGVSDSNRKFTYDSGVDLLGKLGSHSTDSKRCVRTPKPFLFLGNHHALYLNTYF